MSHRDPDVPPEPPPADPAWGYLLDLDGTLIEIASSPDAVVVDDEIRQLLEQLYERTEGAVAVVTGRAIDDLDGLLAPLRLPAAGLHGLQRRRCDGTRSDVEVDTSELEAVYARCWEGLHDRPGVQLEHKGRAMAVHYRRAPEEGRELRRELEQILAELAPSLELLAGRMVYELRPRGAHKGHAVATFLDEAPFRGRRPVFAGDDLTDENGFIALNPRDGITVRVGESGHSEARWRLPSVRALRNWLRGALTAPRGASDERPPERPPQRPPKRED